MSVTVERANLIRSTWERHRVWCGSICADQGQVRVPLPRKPDISFRNIPNDAPLLETPFLVFEFQVRDDRQHWRIMCEGVPVQDGLMRDIGRI